MSGVQGLVKVGPKGLYARSYLCALRIDIAASVNYGDLRHV